MRITPALLLFTAISALPSGFAGPAEEVEAATQAWVDAFNTRDPEQVLALYAADAVFWGTVSPTLRDTPEEIRDYFKSMPERPESRVSLGERRVRVFGSVALSTGLYTFTDVRDGERVAHASRFSFAYRKTPDGRWLIVDHHSSAVPAPRS